MLAGIAWKNIWRNKKRSAVILTAIALGLCGGLFATGIMIGMAESMVNSAIDRDLAHIQIHTKAFKENPLVQDTIPDADSLTAKLRFIPGMRGVSGRAKIVGMASSPATNSGVEIDGINPISEKSVTMISQNIREGVYLDSTGINSVLVGRKLAEKLNLHIHSKLVLSFPGLDGSITYGAFRIVGIFETESAMFDKSKVFVDNRDLSRLLGGTTVVHEIALRLVNADLVPHVLAALRAAYPQLIIESWKDLAPELKLTSELTNVSMVFFLAIILFGLLFGITNTMLMSVLDRTREFGMIMAIGMKRKRVFAQIILETVFLSLVGSTAGIAAGTAVIAITHRTGINLSAFSDGLSSYGIGSMLYPIIPFEVYIELGFLIFLTALCASVYPGFKATRLNPAEAMRTYA
ncbi:MAG: FtsX-like permease family protein [Bacteroidota bacterium]